MENEYQKTGYDTGPLLSLHPESQRRQRVIFSVLTCHPVQPYDSIIEIKEHAKQGRKKKPHAV